MDHTIEDTSSAPIDTRAKAFVDARLNARAILAYPGSKPATLGAAYTIQDSAIDLYPDTLTGWKVGGIGPELHDSVGQTRLVGPVFEAYTRNYEGAMLEMPVFSEGFAAVEGEVTAVLGRDVPEGVTDFTTEDAISYIASMHVGIEIASSPFPEINDHGPLVTISDFGNNFGLVLGDRIDAWPSADMSNWVFRTEINGRQVGSDVPGGMPGGPVESVRYALENTARRGRPMKAGMKILTGAVTGVHRAYAGDEVSVDFCGAHKIRCKLIPWKPLQG